MSEVKCTLCQADFRPGVIEEVPAGVPKCPVCVRDHPKALTRAEILVTAKNQAVTLSEPRVKAMVYEILEEAGLSRHKCEKCHAMFFRRGLLQKLCPACDAEAKKGTTKKKGDK